MSNSPHRAGSPQPSRDFHRNIPILELPAEHVAVLHGRATAGHVAIATLDPGWSERAIPVEDLPRYLDTVPLGVNVYLSQARFRGWRRTQLLSSVNALWVDVDHLVGARIAVELKQRRILQPEHRQPRHQTIAQAEPATGHRVVDLVEARPHHAQQSRCAQCLPQQSLGHDYSPITGEITAIMLNACPNVYENIFFLSLPTP